MSLTFSNSKSKAASIKAGLRENTVILYSIPNHPACVQLRQELNKLKVDFVEKDVTTDAHALQEAMQLSQGSPSLPLLVRGGTVLRVNEAKDALKFLALPVA